MSDHTSARCPYDGTRKVVGASGCVFGPYCIGHAEDFVRRAGGEVVVVAPRIVGKVLHGCVADWLNAAMVP